MEEAAAKECEKDIRQAFAAGASRVTIDFPVGRLSLKADKRNPRTDASLLPHILDLVSRWSTASLPRSGWTSAYTPVRAATRAAETLGIG